MKKVQQGFTLIELMIVIAIIGILAAIALPAYQQYIAKSKFSEVVLATSGVKSAMEICAQTEGGMTNCTGSGDPAISAAIAGATAGQYVSSLSVSSGAITATAVNTGSLAGETYKIDGNMINGAVKWTVDSTATGSTCYAKGYCK